MLGSAELQPLVGPIAQSSIESVELHPFVGKCRASTEFSRCKIKAIKGELNF